MAFAFASQHADFALNHRADGDLSASFGETERKFSPAPHLGDREDRTRWCIPCQIINLLGQGLRAIAIADVGDDRCSFRRCIEGEDRGLTAPVAHVENAAIVWSMQPKTANRVT